MDDLKFPKGFLFGVATSACQVEGAGREGGKGASIWDVLAAKPGAIWDGSTPEISCDQYHHLDEDVALLRQLGVQSYRFSFSWPRILPTGTGKVNRQGMDYYHRLVDALNANGIVPNATLYHWDLPAALDERGGWLNRDAIRWFADYASLLYDEFGDSIPLWATVNEPIATYVGYSGKGFAPNRGDEASGRQANHILLMAHGEAVRRFRQAKLKGKIGIVVDIWHHHPLRADHPGDVALAELENEKSYRSYLNPIFRGAYTDALLDYMARENCLPEIREGDMELIHRPLDFFGLNCYNRVVDCVDPSLLERDVTRPTGGNFLDNGVETYPRAVYEAAHILADEYKIGIPIYITENGMPNGNEDVVDGKIHDTARIGYIRGFLNWTAKAIAEGIDIRGYYLWSLLDNWEWVAGYSMRYGMVHVDFNTQRRILKDSARWYSQFIAEHSER